jgi:hypothetical protein
MKRIFVDAFTFEVARALDRDLSEKLSAEFALTEEQQRLVAVLFALADRGFVIYEDYGRKAMFCFGAEAKPLKNAVSDDKLIELAAHKVQLMLTKSRLQHSIELSKRYGSDLELNVIVQSWKAVGTIVDYLLKGSLRLIGPASPSGLIVEHLSRSTLEQKCYVWFSLGGRACEEPVMVDLAEPLIVEGRRRFPTKADEQIFVTLGFSKR